MWDEMEKILSKEKSSNIVGLPIVKYRKVLDEIIHVLRTEGCQQKMISREYSSGSTCHRRFKE